MDIPNARVARDTCFDGRHSAHDEWIGWIWPAGTKHFRNT